MKLRVFEDLPDYMQNDEVREYYDILSKKKVSLMVKRYFDVLMALLMLVILLPVLIVIAICIASDSPGEIFYRQVRVTTYGKKFRIHKFRTMVSNADQIGTLVTTENDSRITKTGEFLRRYRLDELPQLLDILSGNMSFVGTRPEVPKYVKHYTKEMRATLLLPAGVTSEASIKYKDEAELLDSATDVDNTYINQVLPKKMKYNLESLWKFSCIDEIKTMVETVFAVLSK